MRWEEIRDQWREVTARMKSEWGKARTDYSGFIAGKGRLLRDRLRARYRQLTTKDEQHINGWAASVSPSTATNEPSKPITIETRT